MYLIVQKPFLNTYTILFMITNNVLLNFAKVGMTVNTLFMKGGLQVINSYHNPFVFCNRITSQDS